MRTEVLAPGRERLRLVVRGAVQGVGFRPFVYRLAVELGLGGWVQNSARGVVVEVEGASERLETFRLRLESERPPHAFIQSAECAYLDAVGLGDFAIRPSDPGGEKSALVLPDLATCEACLRELFDPADRRFRYPFANCTHCGPRYSIVERLPYDRASTTMKGFALCPACRAEYEDPLDRRFHAQPIACPECGPQLQLWDARGRPCAGRDEALRQAAEALARGALVAVKGLGGFHLMADARSERVVARLRAAKDREEKPLALMYPSLEALHRDCGVGPLEEQLLRSSAAPIVLLQRRRTGAGPARAVAPGNPCLGVMLPYTPLHHLLLAELGFPVVATSGNRRDEPMCIDEGRALEQLGGLADFFLVHDRPIGRRVDDSIARLVAGRPMVLRRARGYAPLPLNLKEAVPPLVAAGAHLKNAVAVAAGRQVFLSQHIGDLETGEAVDAFEQAIGDLGHLYDLEPVAVACDRHPDYASSRWASASGLPVVQVGHHLAHVLACMAENELQGRVLGVSWDGTGYGEDGSVWGGEFFAVEGRARKRVAHLRPFPLPGGERAVREPRRSALGLLYALGGAALVERRDLAPVAAFAPGERKVLQRALERGVNAPLCSSAGRLFDAVASLAGVRQVNRFEGQAAMELEWLAEAGEEGAYPLPLAGQVLDWGPLVEALLADLEAGLPAAGLAARFHNALVEGLAAVAGRQGIRQVVLTGGCFQNRLLAERAIARLRAMGLQPYWHQRVPPNDGGVALGQVVEAAQRLREE